MSAAVVSLGIRKATAAELARRARAGEEQAFEELARRMQTRLSAIVSRYFADGLTREDLSQHALIGLYEAARDFDSEAGAVFEQFAFFCALRETISAVRTANRRRHEALNSARSFQGTNQHGDEFDAEGWFALKSILDHRVPDVHEQVELRQILELICEVAHQRLSDLEQQSLALSLSGWSRVQIAEQESKAPKSIENALRRARRKLEEGLEAAGWPRDRAASSTSPRQFLQQRIQQKRERVGAVLRKAGVPLTKQEIASRVDCPVQGLHNLLLRMVWEGEICEPEAGKWSVFAAPDAAAWPSHWRVAAA